MITEDECSWSALCRRLKVDRIPVHGNLGCQQVLPYGVSDVYTGKVYVNFDEELYVGRKVCITIYQYEDRKEILAKTEFITEENHTTLTILKSIIETAEYACKKMTEIDPEWGEQSISVNNDDTVYDYYHLVGFADE